MSKLNQKVALVTGASRGIGRAIALRLAKDGAAVIVNYAENPEPAAQVVAEIKASGGHAISIKADVAKVADIASMFEQIDRDFGRLDIVVNNAGVGALLPLDAVDEETFDRLFAINAKGPLFVSQQAARRLKSGGRIVNVSSSTTYFPLPNTSVYAASKIVPRVYTEVLAKELGPLGITVNSVVPGPTAPGMFANAPESVAKGAAAQSPFNRIGRPEDIAGVVAFLVSDDASWVTGQHIMANGGATI